MSTIEKWMENHNGNWVWVDGSEGVRATVYANHDGTWGAIWNRALDGRPAPALLGENGSPAWHASAEDSCRAVDEFAARTGHRQWIIRQ
jgi:hypothetical protein